LPLQGLAEDDAIHWFQALMRLLPEPLAPLPEREPLKGLFAKVGFHPLSVGMLARQLKFRRIAELGERLEAFLRSEHGDPLLASLNLSLDRLDPQSTQFLPRLGVFHGGALENVLIAVCELTEAQWLPLRQGLEQTGLLQAESLPGVAPPFLRFHPTLAPALWAKLPRDEQARLGARHREGYYELSQVLYHEDAKVVAATRAIAWRELPNLLAAAHRALDAGDPWTGDFANNVSRILSWFDLRRDLAALNERAQAAAREAGSDDWYLAQSARGEALFAAGRYHEAEKVFVDILPHLGDAPSHRRCLTLERLGRCYDGQQQAAREEATFRQALAEADRIEQTESTRRLVASLQADLGNALTLLGRYWEARAAHEAALAIAQALGDDRCVAVSLAQLGTIALEEGNLGDADRQSRPSAVSTSALWRRHIGTSSATCIRGLTVSISPSMPCGSRRASKRK
jgi:tetratricopeptide (TPR) repeat protein